MYPPIQNNIIGKQKVKSTVKSSRQFNIDTYLDTKFLTYFKNTIEMNETNLSINSDILNEMKTKFYVYITVNNETPNADLKGKTPKEISSIKTSNGNYILFLAKLLIYIVDDVLKKGDNEKTKILSNIRTFLTTIEEDSITGIFNMRYGINSSFYNDFKKDRIDTIKYLFHIKFLNDYKTLFTDKLEEIYKNPKYNLCTNYDDIDECNTISNTKIIKLINYLLPEHGGQKIYKKVKLLKKYKSS
jgi:hypothetical protein